MLSGEGNENGEKTTIGLISNKETLQVQHTFFVHFFAVVLHDYNVKLPETFQLHVLWRKCRTCSCSLFFSTAAHFHLGGRQRFSFSQSPPLQNCHVVIPVKMSSLFFISRSSSLSLFFSSGFSGLSPTFSFSMSFSFFIF